jgi:HAD superfamily hydrolase (TIGR01549 family)
MPIIKIKDDEIEAQLILFDLDGTLVNDEDRYLSLGKTRYDLISNHEGEDVAKIWSKYIGVDPDTKKIDMKGPLSKAPRNEDIAIAAAAFYQAGYTYLLAREKIKSIYNEADRIENQNYAPKLFKSTGRILTSLKKAGFKIGVATNGQSKITRDLLNKLGILSLIDIILGADLVNNPKPSPDLILEACKLMNIAPIQTVYVGDQNIDIIAARRANIKTIIGVGQEITDKNANYIINSVASISIN